MPAVQKTRKDKIPTMGRNSCFPIKVHQVLQYASVSNMEKIVRWTADGTGFLLLNADDYMKHIAPHFFPNQKRFRSFERLLNLWGFERQRSFARNIPCWSNPNFKRDRPELCRLMVRIENKGTKKKIPTGPKSYRYDQVNTKLPLSIHQQRQAALEFFSRDEPKDFESHRNPTQVKGITKILPLKKRVTRFEKQDNGAKLQCAIKTRSAQSPEEVGKPSKMTTRPTGGEQFEVSRLNKCLQAEDPRLPEPQKENTRQVSSIQNEDKRHAEPRSPTPYHHRRIDMSPQEIVKRWFQSSKVASEIGRRSSTSQQNNKGKRMVPGPQERLQRWLQRHASGAPQAKAVKKGRPTFARRRKLPTKARLERLDLQIRQFQEAVKSDASDLLSNGTQKKEASGLQVPSPLDKARVCQNGFEKMLLKRSAPSQIVAHVEGQFDDAPEPISFSSA